MKQCRSGITKHKLWSVGLDEVSAFFSSPAPALPHSRAGRDRAALPVCMKVTIPLGISTYFCLHSSLRFLTQLWNTVVFAFWALHSVRFESARCTKHLSNIIPFSNNFYVHLPCSQVTWKWEMESKLFFLEGSSESFHFLLERLLILNSGKAIAKPYLCSFTSVCKIRSLQAAAA